MDVVLDADNDLVLQPDVMFISKARSGIIRDYVRGAPDLVVEVSSPGTERYDRGDKVRWYRSAGVRECWLVDGQRRVLTILDLSSGAPGVEFRGTDVVRSLVLPMLAHAADELLLVEAA
jgi:Uma2 family endonuclease